MREILNELESWGLQGEEIALATLVDTHGPSPRPAGARLCMTRSGRMAGSVSGGCVESDVFQRGLQVLDEGRGVVQRYGISDEMSAAVGLSCGGEIDVLIEPWREDESFRRLREAIVSEQAAALCVGLAPATLLGRRMSILAEGDAVGAIDAQVDAELATRARQLLQQGGRTIVSLPLGQAECRVFIEAFAAAQRLFIVGATHTAIPLSRMAKLLGFHVTVIDPRSPFASRERFPEADALRLEWPDEVLDGIRLDACCHVVTLTHDMKFDIPTLSRALRSEARYIGALGSKRTHERRKQRLREEGFSDADLSRIHTPIGLDIGARTPEEIALAILAEIVALRRGRDGRPLRLRSAPIHADGD